MVLIFVAQYFSILKKVFSFVDAFCYGQRIRLIPPGFYVRARRQNDAAVRRYTALPDVSTLDFSRKTPLIISLITQF